MSGLVDYAISHVRLVVVSLLFILVAGFSAYLTIPKEAEPDVQVPIIYVNVNQQGISPEDAERLIAKPLETQLKNVESLKEMRSVAFEGGAYLVLEFEAGFDADTAISDVRNKVDEVKAELPADADEPKVSEVNLSLFPIIVIGLGGDIPERTLVRLARSTETAIEQIPGVLSADVRGSRDEVIEIIAEPMLLQSYGLSIENLIASFRANNNLVAAGSLENSSGRFAIKVPSLVDTADDLLSFPIATSGSTTVTLGDVATVRPTFKDPTTVSRINGKPAIAIEVSKRAGANLIQTVDAIKYVVAQVTLDLPDTLEVTFSQDRSKEIRTMLNDLQNSVVTAVLLVFVIMLSTLGVRASFFIGIAIPGAFLAGILGLQLAGFTLNIVVLFALVLSVGMLVDDAIIVSEYAERRMGEGMPPQQAYALAAKRMTGPVVASTATRVAAFLPLIFWPGLAGEFMKYLPITLIATLSASMIIALVVTPSLGASIGKSSFNKSDIAYDDPFIRFIKVILRRPLATLGVTFAVLAAIVASYSRFGNGIEFFPEVEPEYALVQVRARGNLSIEEKDALVKRVEERILGLPELETVYSRVGGDQRGSTEVTEDTIGTIQFTFVDWRDRRSANEIMREIRNLTADIPGIIVEVNKPAAGPATGKPITIQLTSLDPEGLFNAALDVASVLRSHPDTRDVDDGLPLPGIDWTIDVDRAKAAQFNASPGTVGNALQLITTGIPVTDYRPDDSDKAVDVIVRYPQERRTLSELDTLFLNTTTGSVPISNFVTWEPEPKVGVINRVDGRRVVYLTANIAEGVQSASVQADVVKAIEALQLPRSISYKLSGEDEERQEASAFLGKAFGSALFLIFAILLAQFNKFSSVLITLTAVVLSTVGVLIGLMVMGQPFGVVMTGIGVIANAGVIVNNNIVLIDTFDRLRRDGMGAYDAVIQTCRERVRPVLLTAVTAILGVLAIAFGVNVDFIARSIEVGAPSTQWWQSLSTAIVFGLGFATILTLIVTPAILLVVNRSSLQGRPSARKAHSLR